MSFSAIPAAVTALMTFSMAALFWASACAAVAAWVTTPPLTSAVSGRAEAVPDPTTVIDGGSGGRIIGGRPGCDCSWLVAADTTPNTTVATATTTSPYLRALRIMRASLPRRTAGASLDAAQAAE